MAGLPTQFSLQSLRVEGDPGIRIGQVAAQDAARTESANSAQAALEARIEVLQDQAAALDVRAGAADIVKGFLERTAGAGIADPARLPLDGRSLAATVAAISQAATEALGRKHEVALRKREIEGKVEVLQRDLARLQSQSRDQRTLTIQLVAERAGAVRLAYQTDGAYATEFEVATPVTLPADGREVLLPLAREHLAARQRVQVSPRQSATAMLMAEVDKPAGVWSGGKLHLLRDGAQVGTMGWTPDAGERWTLSFGRDDKVQVRLAPVQGDAASTGVFERRNLCRLADRITVRSDHAQPVDLLVLEASPISTSDEVKVGASFKPAPTTEAWQDRRGVLAWSRSLAPRESAVFEVAYEVEFPRGGGP